MHARCSAVQSAASSGSSSVCSSASSSAYSTFTAFVFIGVLTMLLSACNDKPAASPPPPPEVAVITIAPTRLALTTELPGRLEASRVAQVRARVPGIILKRTFEEGSTVKAGAVLFRIDPAPLKATFASNQAGVEKAQANLTQANLKAQRYQPLVSTGAISKQEYDDALAIQKQAAADLATARASRQNAGLNLGYAPVTAPINGRIGRAQVTEGALVGQGEATPLATVQQIDPIFVNLTQSGSELLALRRALDSGKLQSAGPNASRVTLLTEDGRVYGQPGKLLFTDVTVDETSGAMSLRAEFPNRDHLLLPGMYVRARLEQAVNDAALTVPQQAVQRTTDGASVLVVGTDDKVAARTIKADTVQGDVLIVTSGLQPGERVIVEGLQKAKPGTVVKTVPWKAPATTAQTPATAADTSAPLALARQ
jgi:membrane fusion protein (multidrug efflux system)